MVLERGLSDAQWREGLARERAVRSGAQRSAVKRREETLTSAFFSSEMNRVCNVNGASGRGVDVTVCERIAAATRERERNMLVCLGRGYDLLLRGAMLKI
jgi:hypothetical protein